MTKTVAREYAGRNITANSIAPGFIASGGLQGARRALRTACCGRMEQVDSADVPRRTIRETKVILLPYFVFLPWRCRHDRRHRQEVRGHDPVQHPARWAGRWGVGGGAHAGGAGRVHAKLCWRVVLYFVPIGQYLWDGACFTSSQLQWERQP